MAADWWNTKYFIRRNIVFTVDPINRVQAGYPLFVRYDYNSLLASNKVRPDFADVEIVHNEGGVNTVIPSFVYTQAPYLYVKFNAVAPIAESSSNYWIYMGNTQLTDAPAPAAYTAADYVIDTSTAPGLGLTFSRPTEDWDNGLSLTAEARAAFVFFGVNARLVMEKGPDRGIVEVTVDNQAPFLIDCYATDRSDEIVYTASGLTLGKHYVRMRVTNQKNPSSSETVIKVVKFQYSRYTEGVDQGEEIYSTITPIRIVIGP